MYAFIMTIIAYISKLMYAMGIRKVVSEKIAEAVVPAAMVNPIAAMGLAAVALSLGLGAVLYANKPEKDNSTMREMEARLKRQEEELHRVVEANQRTRDRERVAHTSATEREALSRLREEVARAETQKAREDLRPVAIRPVVMPTREQISAVKQRVQYNPAKYNFAVCGTAGSGKSSFINAIRGLRPRDESAAIVGVTECTSEVTRYLHNEYPFSRFVWFDIPGAGTINVSASHYFNNKGLFIYDFIVIVYDGRFTEIDEGIIKNCLLFNIPFFLVRSKADQHIENMMKDMDYHECQRGEVVDKYVEDTRADLKRNLEKMAEAPELDVRAQRLLLNQKVYIVSGSTIWGLLQSTQTRQTPSQSIIDENLLIEDMLKQAAKRRGRNPGMITELVRGHAKSLQM